MPLVAKIESPRTRNQRVNVAFYASLRSRSKKLHKNNICLKIIGDVSRFSETLQEKIKKRKI